MNTTKLLGAEVKKWPSYSSDCFTNSYKIPSKKPNLQNTFARSVKTICRITLHCSFGLLMNLLFSWRSGVSVSSVLKVVLMKNANQMVIFILLMFRIKMSTLKKKYLCNKCCFVPKVVLKYCEKKKFQLSTKTYANTYKAENSQIV